MRDRLTDAQVAEVIESREPVAALAVRFGVARKTIEAVRNRHPKKSAYANRERATDFMLWVKTQPCLILIEFDRLWRYAGIARGVDSRTLRCCGVIEANHAGERIAGTSTKALDRTCVPMCHDHHVHWTEYKGVFAGLTHNERRLIAHEAVTITHARAAAHGVEVPSC